MNWNDQGGAAFPFAATDPSNAELQSSGMSLRDYFAGQALVGLLSGQYRENSTGNLGEAPQEAYMIADAMLDARSTK